MDRNSRRGGSERGGRGNDRESGRRGGGFEYKPRTADTVRGRGEQSGSDFDRYLSDVAKQFKCESGDQQIRFLPPTFENAEHYGMDIYVHYGVGPDNGTYLCLHKMKGEACPICEERARAQKDGDDDYAKKLEPKKRVLAYLVDRNDEKAGVQAWAMPWTFDRDVCKISVDKSSGDVLQLDNPEEGYDVEFEKKGSKDRTEYIGVSIARRESDLGRNANEWLDFIQEHPLDSILNFYSYDHIAKAFGGGVSSTGRGEREERGRGEEKEERGNSRGNSKSQDQEYNWDTIHGMTYDEMCDVIDTEKLDIDPDKSKDDEDLADWVCEEMKITKEAKKESRRDEGGSARSRLNGMRAGRD